MHRLICRTTLSLLLALALIPSKSAMLPAVAQPPDVIRRVACSETELREGTRAGGTLDLAASCVYRLTMNLPHIGSDAVIHGHGATIDGAGAYRLLATTGSMSVVLEDLTLCNGMYGEGGALYIPSGHVRISGVTFAGNQAIFGNGGAIWMREGRLEIAHSRFEGNMAFYQGGAVWVDQGQIAVTDSVFVKNVAQSGGAIFVQDAAATIARSALLENAANIVIFDEFSSVGGDGGAVYAGGALSITNSTLAKNTATHGGAIFATEEPVLVASTITENSADVGGGLHAEAGLMLTQSIVAGNLAPEGADIPVGTPVESGGYNLLGDDPGGRLPLAMSDLTNVPAGIEASAEEGMYLLQPDSPAPDAIPPGECATDADQRGVARPQGAGCDIGAVEMDRRSEK